MHTTSDRNYPWATWANGQTWSLRQERHFPGTISAFRHEVYKAAARLNKQVEVRARGKNVLIRFFNPVRQYNGK
jgi:hypothetical protein